jgi:hypothetical protein
LADGKRILSVASDAKVILWDVAKGVELVTLQGGGHKDRVRRGAEFGD